MTTLNKTNPRAIVSESLYACRIEIRTVLNGLVSGILFTPEQRRLLQALLQDMECIQEDLLK
jgi:hypothetical protein